MLNASSPEVRRFLVAWHENGRPSFERSARTLVYDDYDPKSAAEKKRWICLDHGAGFSRSGMFVADRETGEVYTIKAYGRPNRRIGTLASLTAEYEAATATYSR
ncbi:MAG TPA: hypothetical protein VKD21_04420 [Acidimicrobiales bacterium]|nr:hypothetical protein [Acidimicrobiales bacterium]